MSPYLMMMRYDARKFSPIVAFAYWLVAGVLGAHRAYVKDALWPLFFMGHLLTLGLLYGTGDITWQVNPLWKFAPSALVIAWWAVDLFLLPSITEAGNLALADSLERQRLDAEKAGRSLV